MIKCNWNEPNPVMVDFETQSACDLKAYGGRKYAEHESTKILCCSILHNTRVIVWIPSSLNTRIPSLDLLSNRYPTYNFSVCTGSVLPEELGRLFQENTVAAHNLFGFDYHIWKRFNFPQPKGWIDTLYLARASGMPGSLDQLTEGGKDEAKLIVKKLWEVKEVDGEYIYPKVLPGQVEPLVRYAAVDVILMKEIWSKWNKLKVEADVIDSHIKVNQVGVKVDLELVKRIEQVSTYAQGQAENEIRSILRKSLSEQEANAFNIRSGKQMQAWLASKGIKITAYDFASRREKQTLNRKAVEQCLANPYLMLDPDSGITAEKDIDPAVFDILRLRGAALRITDAKMEKALIRTNEVGRALDLFSYHQAHTGRFSSSGIQVHNLPKSRKGVKLNELLRYYEKNLRYPGRGWLFERPSRAYSFIRRILPSDVTVDDGLSALIRPIFIPESGKLLAIADYSAIEARGIAWIAGQDDLLNQFALGIDPYVNFAAKILRKEANEITDDERQIGKVAILGCIAEGTPIKTRDGWVPIEKVQSGMEVWDGIEYTKCDGAIFKGVQPCIQRHNVWMTPDHKVLTEKGWIESCQLNENSPYLPSANRLDDGRLQVSYMENGEESIKSPLYVLAEPLPRCFPVTYENLHSALNVAPNKCTHYGILTGSNTKETFIPYQNLWNSSYLNSNLREYCIDGSSQDNRSKVSSENLIEKKVYDILNAGPRNRFQAGNLIVHNCGYSMGPDKFRLFCGIVGVDLAKCGLSAEDVVDGYRSTYTKIGGVYAGEIPMMGRKKIYRRHSIWDKLNQAATTAIEERIKVTEGKCNFYYEDNILKVELPSGRELWYNNCRIEDRIPMYCYTMGLEPRYKPTIVYDSPTGERSMYGAKFSENITQALCRDIMAEAMVRLHREQFQIVLHCHDEVICEVEKVEDVNRMVEIMSQVPVWASGFPIGVKGYCSPRYLKKPPEGFKEVEANDGSLNYRL